MTSGGACSSGMRGIAGSVPEPLGATVGAACAQPPSTTASVRIAASTWRGPLALAMGGSPSSAVRRTLLVARWIAREGVGQRLTRGGRPGKRDIERTAEVQRLLENGIVHPGPRSVAPEAQVIVCDPALGGACSHDLLKHTQVDATLARQAKSFGRRHQVLRGNEVLGDLRHGAFAHVATWKIWLAVVSNTGRHRSNSVTSPPTIKHVLRFTALVQPPLICASSACAPRAAILFAAASMSEGCRLVWIATTRPAC